MVCYNLKKQQTFIILVLIKKTPFIIFKSWRNKKSGVCVYIKVGLVTKVKGFICDSEVEGLDLTLSINQ